MCSGGAWHVLLLRSDGSAVSSGENLHGQGTIPDLERHVRYVQVSAGKYHSILLRSDGQAVGFGDNHLGQCRVPELSDDVDYVQVSAGGEHSLFLRSDGWVDSCGDWQSGARDIPRLPRDLTYVFASAGGKHSLLLRSDGQVIAVGDNRWGQCDIPPLPPGMTYLQASAGREHSVLLRSDGRAFAFGSEEDGRTYLPDPPVNGRYVKVSAGRFHTALQRDDGVVLSVGRFLGKDADEIDKPIEKRCRNRVQFLQMEAGDAFTTMIKSDGKAVVSAIVPKSQGNMPKVPPLRGNLRYVPSEEIVSHDPNLVLQMYLERTDRQLIAVTCRGLGGEEIHREELEGSTLAWGMQRNLAEHFKVANRRLRVLLQNGCLLHWVSATITLDKLCRATAHFAEPKVAGEADDEGAP